MTFIIELEKNFFEDCKHMNMKDCKNAPVNSVACARPFIVSPVLCRAHSF